MAFHSTLTGNKFFTKPTRILITPYVTGVSGELEKGEETYALDSVVADSTSITQDDAERNETGCETRDENLYETVTLGSYQFTCENADWQEDLVVNVLNFKKSKDGKKLLAPSSYTEKFAEIEIQFGDAKAETYENYKGSVVLPKVLLSSSATLESLKTSLGTMTVAGTAYSVEVDGEITPYYISTEPVTKPQ